MSISQKVLPRHHVALTHRNASDAPVATGPGAPLPVAGERGAFTNRSGATSATASTSTQLAPANAARRFLFIQNVGTADIWINFGAAANAGQPSIKLTANSIFQMDGSGFVSTEAVNVLSATASIAYTAKEA